MENNMAPEITVEEKKLPYAKYWERELTPIAKEKVDIIQGPAIDPSQALPFEGRNDFISGNDVEIKSGFCVMENGTGYVANEMFMPGVTPEMFYWWFAWHSIGSDLRYKIWDKEDHYHARANRPDYVADPAVPVSEKTWNVTHDVLEDIGGGADKLIINFKKPSDAGYDMKNIGTAECAALVCAFGEGSAPALMTHMCKEVDGGIMFYSRFWMGYGLIEGKAVKLLPDGVQIPEIAPRALFAHGVKEYTNLASILPDIYKEEKDNWL